MRIPAAKTVAGIALALTCAATVSYAAVGRDGGHAPGGIGVPPAPRVSSIATWGGTALRIVGHPPRISTSQAARFRVLAPGHATLRCRLDGGAPKACPSISLYRHLGPGRHTFRVQASRPGQPALRAGFTWTVLEPEPFAVSPRLAAIGPLYPGAAATPIPVFISNPNPVPIIVTSLRVSASGGAPGCEPAANLTLTAPALGDGGLRLPAHGTVSLPSTAVAAPTIALRELGVDQDACQDASFNLSFSGSAGG